VSSSVATSNPNTHAAGHARGPQAHWRGSEFASARCACPCPNSQDVLTGGIGRPASRLDHPGREILGAGGAFWERLARGGKRNFATSRRLGNVKSSKVAKLILRHTAYAAGHRWECLSAALIASARASRACVPCVRVCVLVLVTSGHASPCEDAPRLVVWFPTARPVLLIMPLMRRVWLPPCAQNFQPASHPGRLIKSGGASAQAVWLPPCAQNFQPASHPGDSLSLEVRVLKQSGYGAAEAA
jgi:hypothetical protein